MNNLTELNSKFQAKLLYLTGKIEPLLKEKNNLLFYFLQSSGVSNIEDETDLETQYGYFLKFNINFNEDKQEGLVLTSDFSIYDNGEINLIKMVTEDEKTLNIEYNQELFNYFDNLEELEDLINSAYSNFLE